VRNCEQHISLVCTCTHQVYSVHMLKVPCNVMLFNMIGTIEHSIEIQKTVIINVLWVLPSCTPPDACGVDSLPYIAQFVEYEGLPSGYCKASDPLVWLSHIFNTYLAPCFVFFNLALFYTFRFTGTIQIYNTLEGVATALAQT